METDLTVFMSGLSSAFVACLGVVLNPGKSVPDRGLV